MKHELSALRAPKNLWRMSALSAAVLLGALCTQAQAQSQPNQPQTTTSGSVFNAFANGSITLGDQVNTQAYCNFGFVDSPTLNVSAAGFLGSTQCNNIDSKNPGNAPTKVSASGNPVARLPLAAFQTTSSPLNVNFANSLQVIVNDGSTQQQISGNGQVSANSLGQSLLISKQGNVVTIPAGDYASVSLQINGILHFQAGANGTRIQQLNLANCNGMSMEFEPGDYYINQASIQTSCHLKVTPATSSGNSNTVSNSTSVNLHFNSSFTLNSGPTCWNMSDGTCNATIGATEIQAQHPERLKLYLHKGDFITYQGAKVAAGIYADQGDIKFVGAGNSAFIGEAWANHVTTANGGPTAYAYRQVFTTSGGGGNNNPPPSISITPVAPNVTFVAPASITVSLNASAVGAGNSITKVDLYQGSTLVGTTSSPTAPNSNTYSITWNKVPANSYILTAVATDSTGHTTTSAPMSINVINNMPPVVSLTASPANAVAPATILLNATASDPDGSVAKVDFYNGSNLITSIAQAPYNTPWSNVAAGTYSVTAKATDNLGASTTSTPITVTVASGTAKIYDIQTDQINTPRVITDSTGNVVWRWDSTPFGESLPDQNPGHTGTANDFTFNLRFAGQYYDQETNLHYNYFRDYDPATGRYIQSDPIGLGGGINTYAYVEGNPVTFFDPRGLHKGDKWYGRNNREFQRWFHNPQCWKQPGNADADQEEIEEAYAEWVSRGSPKGGKCDNMPPPPPAPAAPICGEDCKQKVLKPVKDPITGLMILTLVCLFLFTPQW
ncbi:RHS repeat-associated core domain-containing protein [Undibacterium sp. Dicai25W]|uniref:RHS repeat-associated core domain-containing protein n=1 Tax=Undibacterium sp. Dicai25W TaxID=3413034 RepID=UPI003BF1471B